MRDYAKIVSRVANKTYMHSRSVMPEHPWWDNLEPYFHKLPDDFYLDFRTKLMVDGTAAVDHVLRFSAASLVGGLCMPFTLQPGQLKRDLGMQDFYKNLADRGDPAAIFLRPKHKVEVERKDAGRFSFHPHGGRSERLRFESPFVPLNPAMRESYGGHTRNRTAWAEHWRHNDGPRPTLCVVHGFFADPYWVNSRFLALPWFYEQGYDILLYTLPFHGRRAGALSPFSGHGYFAHGISHINETMAHAVHDFRVFVDYLEEQGVEKIGVTGISLGGYTTALLASVEDRLHCAIPNVPVVSLVDLLFEWFPAGPAVKAAMRLAGISVQELRHVMAMHCPLTYAPKIPKERLMIISGAGDRLAPPKHSRLLWDHWGRCALHWFPGNHIIHLDQGRYLKAMAHFMEETGFGPTDNPPAKITAKTKAVKKSKPNSTAPNRRKPVARVPAA